MPQASLLIVLSASVLLAWGPAEEPPGAMPARGGKPALSDNDVRAAVDFLAAQVR